MYGGGSQGDRLFADFQASLLTVGQPPPEDPVEDHMNRVKKTVFRWSVAMVVVAGAALWFAGIWLATAVAAGSTFVALGVVWALHRRRSAGTEIPRVVS